MAKTFNNFSIGECAARVVPMVLAGKATFYQKWTCAQCWRRNTMDVPNKFFELAHCQHCNHVTDIKRSGCNYLLIMRSKATEGANEHDDTI